MKSVLDPVADYYAGKLAEHGATSKGVDWNTPECQSLRFEVLSSLWDLGKDSSPSVNDYGCGFGSFCEWAQIDDYGIDYLGCDISDSMVKQASMDYGSDRFILGDRCGRVADFAIASGIFNVKLESSDDAWESYIFEMIDVLARESSVGFGFNCLTSYADEEFKRSDLYYADPCRLFDFCKLNYSRHVSLIHDYGLYEFTILVKKENR